MTRLLDFLRRWLPIFSSRLRALPVYLKYLGPVRGTISLGRVLFWYGFRGIGKELVLGDELRRHKASSKTTFDYIVFAPNFVSNSAGVYVLYKLCADLAALGFRTAITGSVKGAPQFPCVLLDISTARRHARAGAWVIYPEVVSGNPLHAKHVARWVLNSPGLLGGDKVYDQSELIYLYSDVFAAYVKNKVQGRLYSPTIDQTIFYPAAEDAPRVLDLFYVGKSIFKENYVDPNNAFEITRQTPAKKELGKLFRAARVLYSFDNSTILMYEALLCGCPVIVIPDGTQTFEDFQKLELGTEGIYWGKPGELPKPFYPADLLARLNRAHDSYHAQLRQLVRDTHGKVPNETSVPGALSATRETSVSAD